MQIALFHGDGIGLAVGQPAPQFQALRQVIGMGQRFIGVSKKLFPGISDHVAKGVVHTVTGRAVGCMQHHAHGGVVEHAAQDGVLAADFLAVADFTG